MARTAKRYEEKTALEQKVLYRAGIYVRLSSDRKEEWREKSSSPEAQIITCKEYAIKESIEVIEVYEDYEYSGTNFERPAYQQMMMDIRNGKINCIIIRDLSRLGREHLEMGRLIDKVFPFLGVRFISVVDKLDTKQEVDSNKSFEVMLKNIINDMYAKDISAKIISSKHNRARQGFFIGSVPPYGYKIEKTKLGQRLIIDENTAPIVREIFQLAADGMSQYKITLQLNRRKITTAMTYYKTGRMEQKQTDPQWCNGTIGKLLRNETYTGTLIQGKRRQNLAREEKRYYTASEEWIVCENCHEPIISKKLFDTVQIERKKRKENYYFSYPQHGLNKNPENRYKGLIFSKETGKELYRRYRIHGKNRDEIRYIFMSENYDGALNKGKNIYILEQDLDTIVKESLMDITKKIISKKAFVLRTSERFRKRRAEIERQVQQLYDNLERSKARNQRLYERYSLGTIDKEQYLLNRENEQGQLSTYKSEIARLEVNIELLNSKEEEAILWIKSLFKVDAQLMMDKELLSSLIERIDVNSKDEINIQFTFTIDELFGGESHE